MMLPLSSILFAYAGVAAACAGRAKTRRPRLLSAGAAAAIVAAFLVSDGGFLGGVCVVLASSLSATLFVLLEAIAPRALWASAAAALLLAIALAAASCAG
jgi:hypothetical protein